jgi:hypothetical protein
MQALEFLALIGVLAILVGVGAAVFFFGGFFNVGADLPALCHILDGERRRG